MEPSFQICWGSWPLRLPPRAGRLRRTTVGTHHRRYDSCGHRDDTARHPRRRCHTTTEVWGGGRPPARGEKTMSLFEIPLFEIPLLVNTGARHLLRIYTIKPSFFKRVGFAKPRLSMRSKFPLELSCEKCPAFRTTVPGGNVESLFEIPLFGEPKTEPPRAAGRPRGADHVNRDAIVSSRRARLAAQQNPKKKLNDHGENHVIHNHLLQQPEIAKNLALHTPLCPVL